MVGAQLNEVVRVARQQIRQGTDAWHAIRATARQTLGPSRLADLVAFEVAMPYYALCARRARLDANTFSVDRETGYGSIFALLILALAVEVVVVHLIVVSLGGTVAAWVFTAVGIYGGLWLVADYRAIRNRAILLGDNELTLRLGFRWEAHVPYRLIDNIQAARWSDPGKDCLNLSVFGDPKLVLRLSQPVVVEGLYGVRRSVLQLGLRIDNQAAFVDALQAKLDLHAS
jgi:hypothetical protein